MAIKRLCFFHFVEDFERPIEALRNELDGQRDAVDNSLIVLPEAFNIGDYWRPRQESDYDPRILNSLSDLAVEFTIASQHSPWEQRLPLLPLPGDGRRALTMRLPSTGGAVAGECRRCPTTEPHQR